MPRICPSCPKKRKAEHNHRERSSVIHTRLASEHPTNSVFIELVLHLYVRSQDRIGRRQYSTQEDRNAPRQIQKVVAHEGDHHDGQHHRDTRQDGARFPVGVSQRSLELKTGRKQGDDDYDLGKYLHDFQLSHQI